MPDYANPYLPNVLSNAYALQTIQGLMQRQQQNEANMAAANAIANGDYLLAEQYYRSAGMNAQADAMREKHVNIEAGNHIANGDYDAAADTMLKNGYYAQARRFTQDHINDINSLYGIGAQIAQIPNLQPEQWKQFIDTAKRDGFDTAMFEDPKTGPALMAAYAGKIKEYNDTLTKRKSDEDAITERAKRIAAGLEPWPNATRGDTEALAVQKKVRELEPQYNAGWYKYHQEYINPNKFVQRSLNAFETALEHAEGLNDILDSVTDTGTIPTNSLYHLLQRWGGNEALKSFETHADALGNELDKAFVGGVGTGAERMKARENVSSSLPKSAIRAGNAANVELMLGKMLAFEGQYRKATGGRLTPPESLNDKERNIIRKIFAAEPDPKTKADRYARLSRDPRTADLVEPPEGAPESASAPQIKKERPAGYSDEELRARAQKSVASGNVDLPTINEQLKAWGVKPLEDPYAAQANSRPPVF